MAKAQLRVLVDLILDRTGIRRCRTVVIVEQRNVPIRKAAVAVLALLYLLWIANLAATDQVLTQLPLDFPVWVSLKCGCLGALRQSNRYSRVG